MADYKSIYDDYWSHEDRHGHMSCDLSDLAERFVRYGAGSFLDVGCGEGWLVQELCARGVDAKGMDISEVALASADKRLPGHFRQGSATNIPFPDDSFDTVVSSDCLEHLTNADVEKALSEMRRVARKFVILQVATEPDRDGMYHLTVEKRAWWENLCFRVGLRKHSCYYDCLPYEKLDHDGWQIVIPMEKVRSEEALSLASGDMLRETGGISDALCACYQKAAEFVCEGDRVLDLACGSGYGAKILLENSLASEVRGIDVSARAIAYAQSLFASEMLTFGEDGALANNGYDFIFFRQEDIRVQDFLQRVERALPALVPSGRIVLLVESRLFVTSDERASFLNALDVWGLLVEKHFSLTGSGRNKMAPRRLREVPAGMQGFETSEFEIVVAMKDPLLGKGQAYIERRWRLPTDANFNVSAFARDYLNPYLVKGMVTIGLRMSDPLQLQRLQLRVLAAYPRNSVDYGAALCGAIYSETLLKNGRISFPELCTRVEEYCTERQIQPHRLRWQVSCLYALGSLASSCGKQDFAVGCWQRCLSYDVSVYSPLLGTKIMDSAFYLARHFVSLGETGKAKRILRDSIREAERLLSGSWINIRGNIDAPMSFGYAESSQLLEKASRASYFLNALTRWPNRSLALKRESQGFTERAVLNFQRIIKEQTAEIFELQGRLKAEKFYSEKANREQTAEIFELQERLKAEKFYSEKANREQTAEIFSLRAKLSLVLGKIDEFNRLISRLSSTKAMRLAKFIQAVRNPRSHGFNGAFQALCHAVRSVVRKTPFDPSHGIVAVSREFWQPVAAECALRVAGDTPSGKVDIVLQADNFMVGGLENVMIDQACYFKSAGQQVVILVLGHPGESVKLAEARGISVVVLPDVEQSYRAFMAKALPSVVFANCSYDGAKICKSMGIPFVQVVHNTYVWTRTMPKSKRVILDSLPYTTACVCVSKQVADFFVSEYHADPCSTFVIPNGIQLEKFNFSETARDEIRAHYGIKKEDTLLIAAASIGDQKNYPALLRAMTMVLKECPTAKLLIVGHVYDEGIFRLMKETIAEAHVEEHIIYIGCVPDIERYFSAADLLVHCSFYEGGPLTVIEGLATSLPFLATRTGCLLTLPDTFSGCTIIPPQIPIEELTSPRLWEQSAAFDADLAKRIVAYCKSRCHDRVIVSPLLRKRFAREYAFDAYLKLTRILKSKQNVSSFSKEQSKTWVDYVEENRSL